MAAVADAPAIDRFLVAGHSSGGPYALACGALLAERVRACIVLGGVTDMGWAGAWDGYPDAERQLMQIPDQETATAWCAERFGADGSGFLAASGFELSEPDERLYEDAAVARSLTAARAEAFRQVVAGYAQDIVIQGGPWTFDPGAIVAPVHVLHGAADTLLPVAHSRHTSELIAGSHLLVLPEHGHFSILSELPRLASAILAGAP